MAQPTRKEIISTPIKKKKISKGKKRNHPKYGTSKLETRFAENFLDKLGLKYDYQFEAKDIKRFYDFAIYTEQGSIVLIEIDGDFWHGYGKLHEEKNPMQKHSEWVDKQKDLWAASHGIVLIRIWEHDIEKNPAKVMKMLKERLFICNEEQRKINEKKQRH